MSKLVTAADSTNQSLKPQTPQPSTESKVQPAGGANKDNTYNGYRLPDNATLIHACKLSIVEDKPILLDYWTFSIDKQVLIGVKDDADSGETEKFLMKSSEEYTSTISKIYGSGKEYIIITENSIYIVDKTIPIKRISY